MISAKVLSNLNSLGSKVSVMPYNLYDLISNRYGNEQPKGGVIFNSPVRYSLNRGLDVGIDSYGRGSICNVLHSGGVTGFASRYANGKTNTNWNRPMPFPSDVSKTFKALQKAKSIVLGVNSDPFMWMDRRYSVTREILNQILETSNVMTHLHGRKTVVINTRSDLVAQDEYLDLLLKLNDSVNLAVFMHMPSKDGVVLEDEISRLIERGAPSIKRRMMAIDKLKASGITVHIAKDEVDFSSKQIKRELGSV
jgi:hypothetical protein